MQSPMSLQRRNALLMSKMKSKLQKQRRTLAAILKSNQNGSGNMYHGANVRDNVPSDRARLFGELVADTLMQYDQREWVYSKKKVLDVFCDYEQQKCKHNFEV